MAGTTQSGKQDERQLFQRTSAEMPVDPNVPRGAQTGPPQTACRRGCSPKRRSDTPLLK